MFNDDELIKQGDKSNHPTILMIHALNPFGMAYSRRVNENNVDLNRNALFTQNEWDDVLKRDGNIAGYDDFYSVFNPKGKSSRLGNAIQFIQSAVNLLFKQGVSKVKRAVLSGTYTHREGIYYGGKELEKSHRIVRDFIQSIAVENNKKLIDTVKHIRLIDVHTGLGPLGQDTIMISFNNMKGKIYDGNDLPKAYEVNNSVETEVGGEFDITKGMVDVSKIVFVIL